MVGPNRGRLDSGGKNSIEIRHFGFCIRVNYQGTILARILGPILACRYRKKLNEDLKVSLAGARDCTARCKHTVHE